MNFHWFWFILLNFIIKNWGPNPNPLFLFLSHFWVGIGWKIAIFSEFYLNFMTPDPKSIISICVHFSSIFSNFVMGSGYRSGFGHLSQDWIQFDFNLILRHIWLENSIWFEFDLNWIWNRLLAIKFNLISIGLGFKFNFIWAEIQQLKVEIIGHDWIGLQIAIWSIFGKQCWLKWFTRWRVDIEGSCQDLMENYAHFFHA